MGALLWEVGYSFSQSKRFYVVSGTLTFTYDDKEEPCSAGQVHYCPEGHYHAFANKTNEDATFLCVVPAVK